MIAPGSLSASFPRILGALIFLTYIPRVIVVEEKRADRLSSSGDIKRLSSCQFNKLLIYILCDRFLNALVT